LFFTNKSPYVKPTKINDDENQNKLIKTIKLLQTKIN